LGKGELGTVKLAYDSEQNTYAVKIQEFPFYEDNHEVEVLTQLKRLKGVGTRFIPKEQYKTYQVQELILGEPLENFSQNESDLKHLPLKEQQYIFISLCRKVLRMQLLGITHNDLHWGNIMYDKKLQEVTLIGFGSSKLYEPCQLNMEPLNQFLEDVRVLGEILQARFNFNQLYTQFYLPHNIHLKLLFAQKNTPCNFLATIISTMEARVR
jgi:serine/threonine protein kinase